MQITSRHVLCNRKWLEHSARQVCAARVPQNTASNSWVCARCNLRKSQVFSFVYHLLGAYWKKNTNGGNCSLGAGSLTISIINQFDVITYTHMVINNIFSRIVCLHYDLLAFFVQLYASKSRQRAELIDWRLTLISCSWLKINIFFLAAAVFSLAVSRSQLIELLIIYLPLWLADRFWMHRINCTRFFFVVALHLLPAVLCACVSHAECMTRNLLLMLLIKPFGLNNFSVPGQPN